jgi:hypothetical protein
VEGVSFKEVQAFMARLNGLVPGLDLVLPSEAQWEYACRAGTTTATYAGEMRLLGERSAPVLDAIAWYGGNSGVGFELEEGEDSSDWGQKQHAHERAGTRPVGLKRPNGWGLHDMLGNVWEWCADHWHDGYDGAPKDGSAWLQDVGRSGAARRVVRGGSWNDDARFVRAAYRFRFEPSARSGNLGFRCARVQGVSTVARRAGAGGPAARSAQGAGAPRERVVVQAHPPPDELVDEVRTALEVLGIDSADEAAVAVIMEAARLAPAHTDLRISASRLFGGVLAAGQHEQDVAGLEACRTVREVIARNPAWQKAVDNVRRLFHADAFPEGAILRLRAGFSLSTRGLLQQAMAKGDVSQLKASGVVESLADYLIEGDGLLPRRLLNAGVNAREVGAALKAALTGPATSDPPSMPS